MNSPVMIRVIKISRLRAIAAIVFAFAALSFIPGDARTDAQGQFFRVGERLTYLVSYDQYKSSGFAEIEVVSTGKLEGREVAELRSRLKSNDFLSASVILNDEERVVYAATDTGLPVFVERRTNEERFGKAKPENYSEKYPGQYDPLTLIYALRRHGGTGGFQLSENGESTVVNATASISEKIKTDAGEFDTTVCVLSSDYFTRNGISDVRVNLSNDESRLPVAIRFRSGRREIRMLLAAIKVETTPESSPTPSPTAMPAPSATPKPKATPVPYVDNRPLSTEIPFRLGESLKYRVSNADKVVGEIEFAVVERKLTPVDTASRDSVLLRATVTGAAPGAPFAVGDIFRTLVDPDDLQPIYSEAKFNGPFSLLNQKIRFYQERGAATVDGKPPMQIPVNTHSILSLIYAARSFNLKPSKDATNPVNDTRVAVMFGEDFSVFMLRPSSAQILTLGGDKIPAQMITVITRNSQIDALNIRFWLGNDDRRTPLRFAIGGYQADLIKNDK